jgi:hypothetical protein
MAKGVEYSDRVWCTLLWEFSEFAAKRASEPGLLKDNAELQKEAGIAVNETWDLASPEIRKAVQTITPILFLDFLRSNPEILGTNDLIEWVKRKQANYPFR